MQESVQPNGDVREGVIRTESARTAGGEVPPKGTTSLISDVMSHVSNLLRAEVDLARAEMTENAKKAGIAVGLIAGALIVALVSLNVLAAALVAAVTNLGVPAGWSALIVGVIFAVLAGGMVAKGLNDLKASSLAPTRTVKNVRRDAAAVKESI